MSKATSNFSAMILKGLDQIAETFIASHVAKEEQHVFFLYAEMGARLGFSIGGFSVRTDPMRNNSNLSRGLTEVLHSFLAQFFGMNQKSIRKPKGHAREQAIEVGGSHEAAHCEP